MTSPCYGGLHIYDPIIREIQIIDKDWTFPDPTSRDASRKLGKPAEEILELYNLEMKKAKVQRSPTFLVDFCRQLYHFPDSGAELNVIRYS